MNYCSKHNDLCEHANASGYCSISACNRYEEIVTKRVSLSDGIYMELFAVKNGVRYNAKTISMKDASTILTNSLMDGVEKLWR